MKNTQPASESAPVTPGRVTFIDGQNEMPAVEITTAWSRAEIYLQGAHVTQFVKTNEHPLLFLSQCSRFSDGQPIRGGVPVIFPWFGMREGLGQHGFARNRAWELKEVLTELDGSVSLRFRLPKYPDAATLPPFRADYIVTVKDTLTLCLEVLNESEDEPLTFESCLHTYFEVGDVTAISIKGLKGMDYLDKVANFSRKTENEESIRISCEVDRTYLDTTGPVEIIDTRLGRRVVIEKQGSASTVVWNPWVAKAQQMLDFGDDEYQRMVCVESGNVASNQTSLPPGKATSLTVRLASYPLA